MKQAPGQQPITALSRWAAAAVMFLALARASAPLAITEVMSEAATTCNGVPVQKQSDWWELTNFGTEAIDLTDYHWTDSGVSPQNKSFQGLVIGPGKSVVLFRRDVTPDEAAFRAWWGGCLGTNLQEIIAWDRPGFNPAEDAVRLYDSQGHLVDGVDFGVARVGVTFVSDPETGAFGDYTRVGACGAGRAATTDDIGSPGTACGPVALRILEQPTSILACPGLNALFGVTASGLPRPHYQWLFSGTPVPGATGRCLVIADPQSTDQGEYRVILDNGRERVSSTSVTLTLTADPSPPRLLADLSDVEVFVGETARFSVSVCAFPRPQYQWAANGTDICGATNRTLAVLDVSLEASGTRYSVHIWNTNGSTDASARLVVNPTPALAITEAMPAPLNATNCTGARANWWELTNLGTNAVPLNRFRHSDRPVLSGAKVVTNTVLVQPGESVIFAEQLTREQFIRWWGPDDLPPALQVVTYAGYGLDRWSDAIFVWSAAAELNAETLAAVAYASPTPFPDEPPLCPCYLGDPPNPMCGHPICGHSLFFAASAARGQASEENENGAFRAETREDVGSPGFCVLPRCFGFQRDGSSVRLRWRVVKGKRYQVEWRPEVTASAWTTEGVIHTADGSTVETTDIVPVGASRRFYRLRELP